MPVGFTDFSCMRFAVFQEEFQYILVEKEAICRQRDEAQVCTYCFIIGLHAHVSFSLYFSLLLCSCGHSEP